MDGAVALDAIRLNDRLRGVLFLLCKGLRNAEIAQQLGLSERTIKSHVSQLLLIFDVTNRTELVGTLALQNFSQEQSLAKSKGRRFGEGP